MASTTIPTNGILTSTQRDDAGGEADSAATPGPAPEPAKRKHKKRKRSMQVADSKAAAGDGEAVSAPENTSASVPEDEAVPVISKGKARRLKRQKLAHTAAGEISIRPMDPAATAKAVSEAIARRKNVCLNLLSLICSTNICHIAGNTRRGKSSPAQSCP
jgi:hypothetical protein